VLKLATLPNHPNAAANIFLLCRRRLIEGWVSWAMLEEYSDVLARFPNVLAAVGETFECCHALDELDLIAHEPDNRFVECALACDADYLITVNTARGHFDQPCYGRTRVLTPGRFLNLDEVQSLLTRL